jgi:hypothetical protein
MRDAVDLIGKTISIGLVDYIIVKVYFLPEASSNEHDLYFGLSKIDDNITIVNYSYYNLLPYMKQSIKNKH